MARVIYNGNGSDGGQLPADSNTYVAGATVNVASNYTNLAPFQQTDGSGNAENIVTGNLSRTGAAFLYWNTAANGSGTTHGWPLDTSFTFPNQTGNLTLYAQWAVTTGLINGGQTSHYAFFYDESLGGPGGVEPARTNSLLGPGVPPVCETDFAWMQTQFLGVDITKATSLPIQVYVTVLGGGANTTAQIRLKPGPTGSASAMRSLIVSEVVEILMNAQHEGWGYAAGANNEQSCGEALSMFLTQQFQLQVLGIANPGSYGAARAWLNSALPAGNPASTEYFSGYHYGARGDYVNATLNWPGNGPASGCSLLFIYYLHHQLGFTIAGIVASPPGIDSAGNTIGGSCLRGVYRNLTGDSSDPFPYFANLLAGAFPPNQVAAIPGPNQEDPWPIGSLSFVGAKNTWGHDEINDIIGHGGTYSDGVFLALDGFSLNTLGGTQPQVPTIAFGGVAARPSASAPAVTTQSSNPKVPQTILFAYDLTFAQPLGAFPASGETPAAVNSTFTVLGKAFAATTEFFFLAGADPYFTNVAPNPHDRTQVNVPWLSQDLRVFTATPGAPPASQNQYPVSGGPQFVENSVGGAFDIPGAYAYLQALLVHLNQAYGDPGGVDPFDASNNIIPQQQTEFTADSSVTPFTSVGGSNYNNYSFAIARVRLKGSQGSAASGVKVFFRLWGTQTADTGWDPTSTYLSNTDSSGNPLWPQAPAGNHTIPFFATSAQPNFTAANDPEFKTGGFTGAGANNQTITIQQGDAQWAYFGCFLDVNDASALVNGVAIPNAFPGTHHCLVAQIAYAGAPIRSVGSVIPTPETSDQLAQRNLQVTTSDNPGPPSTHRVPQTFDVRPSGAAPATGPLAGRPDELMIDWGDTPPGSVARIYWPAASAAEVVGLASWMHGVHPLKAADTWTIEMRTVRGVTYVPIPQGMGPGLAGLFTVDLPPTVVTGQEFNIVVRRISTRLRRTPQPPTPPPPQPTDRRRRGKAIAPPQPNAPAAAAPGATAALRAASEGLVYERYIVGSFQVKIPVSTAELMLPAEETTLAILKARLDATAPTNRWYPVLQRYIDEVSARVDGLGGDAGAVPASLSGYRGPRGEVSRPREEGEVFVGKVCEVVFDCFGDFSGFVIDDCCERRAFESKEREIGELVVRALRDRLTLAVFLTRTSPHRIARLVVRA